jgi:hypothetical protein
VDGRQELVEVSDGDVPYKVVRVSNSIKAKDRKKSEPAANAAAVRISSCSAAKCSIAFVKTSFWGDMSLGVKSATGRTDIKQEVMYMNRPNSPRIMRLRTT